MSYSSNQITFFTVVRKALLVIVITVFSAYSLSSLADSTITSSLALKPKQCVAMHQGQECFADIELTWRANHGDYCIFSSQQKEPLRCWRKKQQAQIKIEVVSNRNVRYELRQMNSPVVLSSVELEMAWVYKKNSRSHVSWRMF